MKTTTKGQSGKKEALTTHKLYVAVCKSREPLEALGKMSMSKILSCPIPVVSTCSRCSTAWIRASVPTTRPAALCKAARAAPARMLLVPAGYRGSHQT